MRRSLAGVVLCLALACSHKGSGGSAAGGGGSDVLDTPDGKLSVWTATAGRKIQPSTAAGSGKAIAVASYRDAWISAQIAVHANAGHLAGVRVALDADLSDGKGHALPQTDVTFFREVFIDFSTVSSDVGTGNVPVPASSPTRDARVPDPLVPLVDPYSDALAGEPFDVAEGDNQPIFVDVHVPKGLAAGTYTGTVHVTADVGGSADVPISVTVWPLDLPDMRSVTTHFKMTINNLYQYHAGLQTCGSGGCFEDFTTPQGAAVLKRYEELTHAHRIDTGQGLVNVPETGCVLPVASDWAPYDAAMASYMDGSYFSDGVPSGRFDVPFAPGQSFGVDAMCSEDQYVALSHAWASHLASKGWFPAPKGGGFGAVAYAYDEPLAASSTPSDVQTILDGIVTDSSWLQKGNPAWKAHVIDTTSPLAAPANPATVPLLNPALGVYVVSLNLYGDVWNHGAFYGRQQWQQSPDLFAEGLQMWFYEGNSVLPPFPTFASNTLDALEPVIMMWGSWYERATGFLFWDIADWNMSEPWGPEIDFGKTGDGVLIYPGNHDGTLTPAGSPSNIAIAGPIPSYRLKMIRQGLPRLGALPVRRPDGPHRRRAAAGEHRLQAARLRGARARRQPVLEDRRGQDGRHPRRRRAEHPGPVASPRPLAVGVSRWRALVRRGKLSKRRRAHAGSKNCRHDPRGPPSGRDAPGGSTAGTGGDHRAGGSPRQEHGASGSPGGHRDGSRRSADIRRLRRPAAGGSAERVRRRPVRLLLDTHVWLWLTADPERLGSFAMDAVVSESNEVYLSAASAWEIVIKHSLGKLDLPLPPGAYVPSRVAALGHMPLAIVQEHTLGLADLPLHHKDPFDRILIAQARVEGMRLVTADHLIRAYDVPLLWAGT